MNSLQPLGAARLLALGGVLLIAGGMVLGEIYAIYISHVANSLIKANWVDVVDAAVTGDTAGIAEHFSTIDDLTEKRGRTMNTHSHMAAYGLLALLLAHLQMNLNVSPTARRAAALIYLGGAGMQLGGVYLSYYIGSGILYLSDFGAVLVIGSIIWTLLSWRVRSHSQMGIQGLASQLRFSSSRFLVKSGLALILAGMTFGVYYAWELVTVDEPSVYRSIDAAIADIASEDRDSAVENIAVFKRMQSKIAITAAAHSHAIEFGFLMLLLGLVQKFVLLADKWRLRWARVLATGAWLLPVCVYLATYYGLRAAAFADLAGGLVLLGLCATGFGIVRHTGAIDVAVDGDPH